MLTRSFPSSVGRAAVDALDRADAGEREIEEIRGADGLARQPATRREELRGTARRGPDAAQPNPKEMLPAVAGFMGQLRGLDSTTPQEALDLRAACGVGDELLLVDDFGLEERWLDQR